jgi:hypothetical protein
MKQLDINEYRAAETALYGAEAADYFSRIRLAGSSITTDNKVAVGNFIEGCKADGIWSSIKASCLLAGPDTLAGALVPLVGPTPINSSFSNTDYNRITGLIGDGLTKQISTNYAGSPVLQDNVSASVWGTTFTTANGAYVSCGRTTTGATAISRSGGALVRCQDAIGSTGPAFFTSGLYGVSRSNSSEFVCFSSGVLGAPVASTSQTQSTDTWTIFNHSRSTFSYSNSRLSFYHVGNALNLTLLNARLATYMSSLT